MPLGTEVGLGLLSRARKLNFEWFVKKCELMKTRQTNSGINFKFSLKKTNTQNKNKTLK